MLLYQRLKIATSVQGETLYEVANRFGCHPTTLHNLDSGPISDDIKQKALDYISKAEDRFQAYITSNKLDKQLAS